MICWFYSHGPDYKPREPSSSELIWSAGTAMRVHAAHPDARFKVDGKDVALSETAFITDILLFGVSEALRKGFGSH